MFRSSLTAAEWLLRPQLATSQITALRTAKQIKLKLPKGKPKAKGKNAPKESKTTAKRKAMAFPPQFEEKLREWPRLLRAELEFDGARTTADDTAISEADIENAMLFRRVRVRKHSFEPLAGALLELELTPDDTATDRQKEDILTKVKRGLPVSLVEVTYTSNPSNRVEAYFWDVLDDHRVRIRLRQKFFDMDSVENRVFHVCRSFIADIRLVLLEFLEDRPEWKEFPGYELLQYAYRVQPFPANKSNVHFDPLQDLNDDQKRAVAAALSKSRPIVSIQGPPGTGKTQVVTEIIIQAVRNKQKVLVCAPSNFAVDNVLRRVQQTLRQVIRVNPQHQDETKDEWKASLDAALKAHAQFPELIQGSEKLTEMYNAASVNPRDVNKAYDRVMGLHANMKRSVVQDAQALFTTMSSSTVRRLNTLNFRPDVVVVEEAGQAMECATWMCLFQGKKAVLAGDQCQLPAVVSSTEAIEGRLNVSLMEWLGAEFGANVNLLLRTQYRSNALIQQWSSEQFYDSQLSAHESVANIRLADILQSTDGLVDDPLVFVDTANEDADDHNKERYERRIGSSYSNPYEARLVARHVNRLVAAGLAPEKIGVITPYRAQVNAIVQSLEGAAATRTVVSSVDAFQGQEREAIVMSLVRNNSWDKIGFLADYRRLNVAVTRAKRQFFLVGSARLMETDEVLSNLLRVLREYGRVLTAQELHELYAKRIQVKKERFKQKIR